MQSVVLLLITVLASIAPLSPSQVDRLSTAADGRDHLEDAFQAIIENVRQWTAETGEVPPRLNPDLSALLEAPERFRGDLCRLSGRIQQRATLPPPFEDVDEWFIRNGAGEPLVVYVVDSRSQHPYKNGELIEIDARFYKRVDFRARDGQVRGYPAFAGAFPRSALGGAAGNIPSVGGSASGGGRGAWALPAVITALLIAFAVLLVFAQRRRRGKRHGARLWSSLDSAATLDAEPSLPDDPAEALAELKRRASVQ